MHNPFQIVALQAYLQLGDAVFAVPPSLQSLMRTEPLHWPCPDQVLLYISRCPNVQQTFSIVLISQQQHGILKAESKLQRQ